MDIKISVVTPAIRLDELELNRRSLLAQTFKEFEWIVCSPFEYLAEGIDRFLWCPDVPKNEGDFMGENKAYNELFKRVRGELVVTLNDSIWLQPNALEILWNLYQANKMSCVALMGNHYEKVIDGVGQNMTYEDVRVGQAQGDLTPTHITNFDACVSSIPAKAVKEVGSIDPIWDKYCCFGIREFMYKVTKLGYQLFLTTQSAFVAQKHAKLYDPNDEWNVKFEQGDALYHARGNSL